MRDALIGVRRAFLAAASVALAITVAARILDAPRGAIVALIVLCALVAGYALGWPRHVERTISPLPSTTACAHSAVKFGVLTLVEIEGPQPAAGVWCWGRASWVAETVSVHASAQGPLVFSGPHRTLVAALPAMPKRAAAPTRSVGRSLNDEGPRRGR